MLDRDDFLGRVADILEVPDVTPELEFRTVPGWGSMMGFALYIMLEDEYGVKITPERFRELKTVDSLMAEADRPSLGADIESGRCATVADVRALNVIESLSEMPC